MNDSGRFTDSDVLTARHTPLPMDALSEAAACLRTLAHPHRLRIVEALISRERSVGELTALCGISQSACSEHLRLMRGCGLVSSDRRGRHVYYAIAERGLFGIMECIHGRFGGGDGAHDVDNLGALGTTPTDAAVERANDER